MSSSDLRKCSEETPLRLLILTGWAYWLWQLLRGGHLRLYVHPRFAGPVLWAVLFLVTLAAFQATRLIGTRGIKAAALPRPRLIAYIVVLLPLVIGFALPPQGLSHSLAEHRGGFLPSDEGRVQRGQTELEAQFVSSSDRQQVSAEQFRSLAGLLWTNPAAVSGNRVELAGFIYREEGLPPGQFLLARYEISCCAADATVVACLCKLPDGQTLPSDGWVTVRGGVAQGEYQSQSVGLIAVESLTPTEPPADPYIYAGR